MSPEPHQRPYIKYLKQKKVAKLQVGFCIYFLYFVLRFNCLESQIDFGFGKINRHYLEPFFHTVLYGTFSTSVNADLFETKMTDNIWLTNGYNCHRAWITGLVVAMLETFENVEFFSSLVDVCQIKVT